MIADPLAVVRVPSTGLRFTPIVPLFLQFSKPTTLTVKPGSNIIKRFIVVHDSRNKNARFS